VRGVPYDKRSDETLAYVGSLVCRTLEVDKSTLSKTDYVRVKIGARDVSKVPEIVEGSIGLYIYDFFFEREVVMGEFKEAKVVNVFADRGGGQFSPKKTSNRVRILAGVPLNHSPKLNLLWLGRQAVQNRLLPMKICSYVVLLRILIRVRVQARVRPN
jgi:hypothetical protein